MNKIIKLIHDPKKDKNKLLMRVHIGTASNDEVGELQLSTSHNYLNTFVEFPDGTVIGLDVEAYINECIKFYNELKEVSNE